MITRTELREIISGGENSEVEFKRDVLENHSLARELVAFSNFGGGMVLLGVEDDGQVSGLTRSNIEEWVMTTCRDKVRPGLIPFFQYFKDFESGKDIAIVSVPHGFDVHSLWHNNKNTYFIRVGSQCREPSSEELKRLFQQRGGIRAELQPVSGTSFDDLDLRRLTDYFGRVRQQEIPIAESDEIEDWKRQWIRLLINNEIMIEEGVSLGGLLLFGKKPNRFLNQAGIFATALPGYEKDYASKERNTIRGPMVSLLSTNGELLETGLVEQSLDFCRRNMSVVGTLREGARRVEKYDYPIDVIREAVVNALVHRDYLFPYTDIELTIYKNRMEIISPGKPPNGITPERMRDGGRATRNQLLKDTMRDYGYVENMGMGIPRKIIKGMKEHNQTEPELIVEDDRFTVRLFV